MRYLAGDLPVSWVMGSIATDPERHFEGMRQEDAGLGFFQIGDGPIALIETGHLQPTRGYHHIYLDGSEGQMELTRPGGPSLRLRSEATGGVWQSPVLDAELNPVDDLIVAYERRTEPRASGLQGRLTLEVILALFESARLCQRVELPLRTPCNPLQQIFAGGR